MSTITLSQRDHRAAILSATEELLPPVLWKDIIWHYIPMEAEEINPTFSLFPTGLNQEYFERALPKSAQTLSKQFFENARDIHFPVPIDAHLIGKVFAHALQLKKQTTGDFIICLPGSTQVEIILSLVHAGAEKVILMEPFYNRFTELQEQLKSQPKCEMDLGLFYSILKRKPYLKNKVDFLFYRSSEDLVIVHDLLKPGGQAICTAPSIYFNISLKEFDGNEGISFQKVTIASSHSIEDFDVLTDIYLPVPVLQQRLYRIYEKNTKTEFQWKCIDTEFQKLDNSIQKVISACFEKHSATLEAIPEGYIEAILDSCKLYNRSNFITLFEKNEFIPIKFFVIDKWEYLIPSTEYPFHRGSDVGMLVVKP